MLHYDQRQYQLMAELLDNLERRTIGLKKAIPDLEGLLWSLKDVKKPWKDSFYKQWAVLEDVYASALDKGFKELPEDYQKLTDDAIRNMKGLVVQVLLRP